MSALQNRLQKLSPTSIIVDIATDGQAGWKFVETVAYELILLDVMLPKLDGISLCRQLRSQGYRMPITVDCRDTTDQVTGLDAGADDYVIKPYKLQELTARIRALLRRGVLLCGFGRNGKRLTLTCDVTYKEQPVQITRVVYWNFSCAVAAVCLAVVRF